MVVIHDLQGLEGTALKVYHTCRLISISYSVLFPGKTLFMELHYYLALLRHECSSGVLHASTRYTADMLHNLIIPKGV